MIWQGMICQGMIWSVDDLARDDLTGDDLAGDDLAGDDMEGMIHHVAKKHVETYSNLSKLSRLDQMCSPTWIDLFRLDQTYLVFFLYNIQ